MKIIVKLAVILLFYSTLYFAQGFKVKADGQQTFTFKPDGVNNQASFYSTTTLEDVQGLTKEIGGNVNFLTSDFSTIKGEISFPVVSLNTGIAKQSKDLKSESWLNADKYPVISFKIKKAVNIKQLADNKIQADVIGDFSLHGVTKEDTATATITYLDESPLTQQRMPGDLLGVQAKFDINLSDYNIKHLLLGKRVAEKIDITVNLVGSNK
ncbi:MAG TPA: YceI family protein [Ignavibacteriaceae bacterium]|nr:YceI family protein [Ignavibacteriaceae bacterium]